MDDEILSVYKPQGMTPFQVIEKLRSADPKYLGVKIGYAGRLDPLAHGVMLLTVGEANKSRQKYLGLDKVYKFSVLFGVRTDSYDYLGLIESLRITDPPADLEKNIAQFVKDNTGKFFQSYPPFSSKTLEGIPLYKLAKKGKILTDNLPTREVEIYRFNLEKIESISSPAVRRIMLKNLRKIKGHFRQTKIIKLWEQFFKVNQDHEFRLADFEIECSSGTYVRSLADRMGEKFKCGGIAFEIFRTAVDKYKLQCFTLKTGGDSDHSKEFLIGISLLCNLKESR